MPPQREKVTFTGVTGADLSGLLHVPDRPRGSLVLAHCFTCSKAFKVTARLAGALVERGFAVLRFDFTGLGESEGDFAETTVATNVSDVIAAAHYLLSRQFGACAVVGHSFGGAAVLLAARSLPTVQTVATVAAPCHPEHLRHLFTASDIQTAIQTGAVEVKLAGRPFKIGRDFFDALSRFPAKQRIGELGRPLLVVHGTVDTVVAIDQGEQIFEAARQPKAFEPILGADHFFDSADHVEQVADVIAGFLVRSLGTPKPTQEATA